MNLAIACRILTCRGLEGSVHYYSGVIPLRSPYRCSHNLGLKLPTNFPEIGTHFFPCNAIGLMLNFARVGGATCPRCPPPPRPASTASGLISMVTEWL